MPLILLDDVGAGGVGGDLGALGFGIGIEAIAALCLNIRVESKSLHPNIHCDRLLKRIMSNPFPTFFYY